jgi:hypothetical protein
MALIIEDGTGVANADSYLSLEEARIIAANYGILLPVDDVEAQIDLRKGYAGLNTLEPQLQGSRANDIQTGAFPRSDVIANCVELASDYIPSQVKMAQLYQANAYFSGMSVNNIETGENLKSFDVKGVYSETYQDGGSRRVNGQVQGVFNELYPFTVVGYRNSPCGKGSGFGNGLGREEFGVVGI